MTRADAWALAAAIACIAIFATVGSLILPVLTLNLEARGESSSLIGAFGALLGFAALVGTPFAPRLVRRLGAGAALAFLLSVSAAANLSYRLFDDSLAAWFAIYFVSALAVGLVFVVAETIITTLAPPARRKVVLYFYVAAFSFGFAIGPLLLQLTGIDGWAPFVVAAVLALSGAALAAAARIPKNATPAAVGEGFGRLFPAAPLPFVCSFALGAAEMSVYDLLPVYARKLNFAADAAAFLLAVFSVGTFLVMAVFGAGALLARPAEKLDSRKLLAAVAAVAVGGAAALPFWLPQAGGGEWAKMAYLGLWGGLLMAIYPLGLSEIARVFPREKLTAANALFGFCYGGGALCGPLLTGAAMDISPHGIAPMLAFFAALPLCASYFSPRRAAIL